MVATRTGVAKTFSQSDVWVLQNIVSARPKDPTFRISENRMIEYFRQCLQLKTESTIGNTVRQLREKHIDARHYVVLPKTNAAAKSDILLSLETAEKLATLMACRYGEYGDYLRRLLLRFTQYVKVKKLTVQRFLQLMERFAKKNANFGGTTCRDNSKGDGSTENAIVAGEMEQVMESGIVTNTVLSA